MDEPQPAVVCHFGEVSRKGGEVHRLILYAVPRGVTLVRVRISRCLGSIVVRICVGLFNDAMLRML